MQLAVENASNTMVQKIVIAQKLGTEKVLEAQERKNTIKNDIQNTMEARNARKSAFEQRLLMQEMDRENKNASKVSK